MFFDLLWAAVIAMYAASFVVFGLLIAYAPDENDVWPGGEPR